MQTINNRMTETQIADLFSLAVQLQVKAEESDDRDTAILAYSIQNACSNLTESQREFRAADATIHNLELKLTDLAVQLANAESKCRELAVECKTLSRFISGSCYVFDGDHDDDMPDEFIDASHYMPIVTPATDAFLAEVRAQGVEMLRDSIAEVGGSIEDTIDLHHYCSDFADQLRKGAAL
ncbi:hypothetical protein [Citrobacter europaeus]|uniref:hypothetical protein n=1 Tax=Citrobacter europaeus TaxID=1914243 RepID=UPI0030D366F3